MPKSLILGAPWRPAGSQHGTLNHPSGTKRLPFSSLRARHFEDLLPRSLSEHSWAAFWYIVVRGDRRHLVMLAVEAILLFVHETG